MSGADTVTASPHAVDLEIRSIAALCTVTAAAAPSLRRDGHQVCEGDRWPWTAEEVAAPIGSATWWRWVPSVLCCAVNTRKITRHTFEGLLNDAYMIAVSRGGVR